MANITSFTSVGTTSWIAPAGVTNVTYLVVGGGGGGGTGYDAGGGGGGAGGMVLTGSINVSPGSSYTITVGAGGNGGPDTRTNSNGFPGSNSVFATITALGGASGQGSRTYSPTARYTGGAAQNGSVSAAVGGGGGGGGGSGGGGGGAGGAGGNSSGQTPGAAGAGVSSSISGSSLTYGSGAIGGHYNINSNNGASGAANTGNGGGGGNGLSFNSAAGGNGGSGIVILSYTASASVSCILRGSNVLTSNGYKKIEDVGDSDLIRTQDGRYVNKMIHKYVVPENRDNLPYRIPRDFFHTNVPNKDTFISPKHAIILKKNMVTYPNVLGLTQENPSGDTIEYYHVEVPDFENDYVIVNNMMVEGYANDFMNKKNKKMILKLLVRDDKDRRVYHREFIDAGSLPPSITKSTDFSQ